MTRLHVDGPTLIRAVAAATANLEVHVDEVDSLNVFPVPDGDTGSNMLATMRSALAEAEQLPQGKRDLDSVAEALSRGALTGARGNSGVILSQIIRGMTEGADGRRRANGLDLAQGLRKGSEVAYGSVLTPVEGTILTVIRDAAEAAEAAAGRQPHVEAVLADVIEAAASSVQRTPTLLPVLEDAGVVDSGGQGLYRVLEGMLQVGQEAATGATATLPGSVHAGRDHAAAPSGGEHGYETQYMLSSDAGGIDVPALRDAIRAVGDSVVVAGDDRLTRVHVHGDRPDLAIAAGLRWGRLSQVEVNDLDHQVAHHVGAPDTAGPGAPVERGSSGERESTAPAAAAPDVAMVAVTTARGLAEVLESFGAHVVRPAHGTRPSVGEITEGILAVGAPNVVVLPNDRDAVLAAGQAASLASQVRVEVIPTRNAAEGIAAAVAFDATVSLEKNLERMESESSSLRSFSVITAAKDSLVDGQQVKQGQIIALDAGRHLLASGTDVETTALSALDTLDDFDLVTIYCGNSEGPGKSQVLCARIEQAGWAADVEVIAGGQPHDHLLVAVE
jgi:DAK2 domain fusion protein YloV